MPDSIMQMSSAMVMVMTANNFCSLLPSIYFASCIEINMPVSVHKSMNGIRGIVSVIPVCKSPMNPTRDFSAIINNEA